MLKMRMLDLTKDLSPDEEKELSEAEKMPLVFDEDSPEMTAEILRQFKQMDCDERVKQTVSLRGVLKHQLTDEEVKVAHLEKYIVDK